MRFCAALLAGLLWSGAAMAEFANLIADRIEIVSSTTIIAEGNVELTFDSARILASRVTYDQARDQLSIEGPLTLIGEDGDVMVLASSAEIDPEFRNGALRSARFILDRQLQIAAAELVRVDGRYTQLSKAIASTCRVCDESETPLWEIRGSSVIHDAEENQIYFDDAQIRLFGVPVFYAPRLRLPDPSLDRTSGFLVPSLEIRSRLGTGVRVPYFFRLSDQADLRFTPFVSSNAKTLEAEYRQELSFGSIRIEGAASRDDIRPDATRAYVFAQTAFRLPEDFTLTGNFWLVSDDEFLRDYSYSDADRLESGLTLQRTRDKDNFSASASAFRTLRSSATTIVEELPDRLFDVNYTRRIFDDAAFGEVWATVDASSLLRPSSSPTVGRDTERISGALDWQNGWTLPRGIVAKADAGLVIDTTRVSQDPNFANTTTRTTPRAAFELRWPHSRTEPSGAQQILEPVLQFAWSETFGDPIPNEESNLVEFDEGNLFALSRFPGFDVFEEGLRANAGVTWTRYDPEGWSVSGTAGRVFRFSAPEQFSNDTGLDGEISDWLIAFQVNSADGLNLTNRSIMTDGLDVSRSETRLGWTTDRTNIAASYVWLAADPSANRLTDASEVAFESEHKVDQYWTAGLDIRYETDADRVTFTGVGLKYENECLGVDLSLARRFTEANSVEPITEFGIRLFLPGFGGRQSKVQRACHS